MAGGRAKAMLSPSPSFWPDRGATTRTVPLYTVPSPATAMRNGGRSPSVATVLATAFGAAFGAVSWGYASAAALQAQAPDMLFGSIDDIVARLS